LTIRSDLWDRGIGARLVEAATARFDEWGTRHAGLFTFAQSAKHVGLYQKYGYWARFLTAIMSAPVRHNQTEPVRWSRYSDLTEEQRVACLKSCRDLTGALYDGLDLGAEIQAVEAQELGETVLLGDMAGAGLGTVLPCATMGRAAKQATVLASSSSGPCVQDRRLGRPSTACCMPARRLP
jgi:hypothetical protein